MNDLIIKQVKYMKNREANIMPKEEIISGMGVRGDFIKVLALEGQSDDNI